MRVEQNSLTSGCDRLRSSRIQLKHFSILKHFSPASKQPSPKLNIRIHFHTTSTIVHNKHRNNKHQKTIRSRLKYNLAQLSRMQLCYASMHPNMILNAWSIHEMRIKSGRTTGKSQTTPPTIHITRHQRHVRDVSLHIYIGWFWFWRKIRS